MVDKPSMFATVFLARIGCLSVCPLTSLDEARYAGELETVKPYLTSSPYKFIAVMPMAPDCWLASKVSWQRQPRGGNKLRFNAYARYT